MRNMTPEDRGFDMTLVQCSFFTAIVGHLLCGIADCLMTFTPNGRFTFSASSDPEQMAELFDGMSLKRLTYSILLGVLGLCIAVFGYLEISNWMGHYSSTTTILLRICGIAFIVFITAHHVCCGAAEWFYVRQGRTKTALDTTVDFFRRTSILMVVGYIALLVFSLTLAGMIVLGKTSLPRWACLFTTLPVYLLLLPTKLPAKGNIAGVVMFSALFALM